MGGNQSREIPKDAYICKYNKETFNSKLDIIRDAHNVSQYYATFLLMEKPPITLKSYLNYSDATEEYFNPTRKVVIPDLEMSYYQFYQYLQTLQQVYERNDNTDNDRRAVLTNIFNKCFVVQKKLIEDLWDDCNGQTPYRIENNNPESTQSESESSEVSTASS